MRTIVRLVFVLGALVLPACGGGTPTSPSGTYDPSKPIGPGNVPPGPGMSQVASVTYSVHEGDCSADVSACGHEVPSLDPSQKIPDTDTTYHVKAATRYSVRECVSHPGIAGREISMTVSIMSGFKNEQFNEGSRPSPVCIATSFESGRGLGWETTRPGEVKSAEFGHDLSPNRVDKLFKLGFRVPDPGR